MSIEDKAPDEDYCEECKQVHVAGMCKPKEKEKLTMSHTPTPWYEDSTGNYQGLIYDEGTGENIAIGFDRADAIFIVKAVNAHEQLINLLSRYVEADKAGENALILESNLYRESKKLLKQLGAP